MTTSTSHRSASRLNLASYVRRRNGVPLGAAGSLQNMLHRSLGAPSITIFWQYWNPIFGFVLAKYVYRPLNTLLPPALSLVLTFVVCGIFHDLFASAVAGRVVYVCTLWFFLMGLGVLLSKWIKMDLSPFSWIVRALANTSYVAVCLSGALYIRWLVE